MQAARGRRDRGDARRLADQTVFWSNIRIDSAIARAQEPDPATNSGSYSGRGAARNCWRFSHYAIGRYRRNSVGPGFGEQKVVPPATPDLIRYFRCGKKSDTAGRADSPNYRRDATGEPNVMIRAGCN